MKVEDLFARSPVMGQRAVQQEMKRIQEMFGKVENPFEQTCVRIKLLVLKTRGEEMAAPSDWHRTEIRSSGSRAIREVLGEIPDDILDRMTNDAGGLAPLALLRQSVLPLK